MSASRPFAFAKHCEIVRDRVVLIPDPARERGPVVATA